MTRKKKMCVLFVAALALWLAKPAGAWEPIPPEEAIQLNDSEEPGSVLVFHQFIRGTVLTPDQDILPVTELEISVTCPRNAECYEHQPVRLRFHWVCPGDEDPGRVCRETVFDLDTTVKGTLSINPDNIEPKTHNIAEPPEGCDRGYLIVWVIEPNYGAPIKFDALIGNAVTRQSPVVDILPVTVEQANGPIATSAAAYNALPIQAAWHLETGQWTDQDGDTQLDFDGTEYKAITGKIFGTVRYNTRSGNFTPEHVETRLTLLTLDVVSNDFNDTTTVGLNFFNEREDPKPPAFVDFVCWRRVSLTEIREDLTTDFGRKGLVESTSATQAGRLVTLVGIVETRESFAVPVAPGVCDEVRSTCENGLAACAATCANGVAACRVVTEGCDPVRPTRESVCPTTGLGVCSPAVIVLNPLLCVTCNAAYDRIVVGCEIVPATCEATVGACTAACTTTVAACTAACTTTVEACTVIEGACRVANATLSVPGLREYSYSLYHDSVPLATSFAPTYGP